MSKQSFKPVWVDKFTTEGLKQFYEDFREAEGSRGLPVIPVVVSSYGGDVHALMGMRDLIRAADRPVATIGLGKAMSAGAMLLAAGNRGHRYAGPMTRIMIHEVSSAAWGKATELTANADETKYVNQMMLTAFAEDTGRTVAFWERFMKKIHNTDRYLSPEEAKDLGIIDHIGVPSINLRPQQRRVVLVTPTKRKR